MRRWIALAVVTLLALSLAMAAVGCGGGQQATDHATEPPPAEQPMGEMPADTAAADTAMGH